MNQLRFRDALFQQYIGFIFGAPMGFILILGAFQIDAGSWIGGTLKVAIALFIMFFIIAILTDIFLGPILGLIVGGLICADVRVLGMKAFFETLNAVITEANSFHQKWLFITLISVILITIRVLWSYRRNFLKNK